MSSLSFVKLGIESEWDTFRSSILDNRSNPAFSSILDRIRNAGGGFCVVEDPYYERDYTDEYSAFYARQFRLYSRLTKRLLFFRPDKDIPVTDTASLINFLKKASSSDLFLGYVIIRPVSEAPLGRAVLALGREATDLKEENLVRTDYEAHLLGVSLRVKGVPFTQQDSRLSACAQASIWMAGRHFHARHGGPWISTVGISAAASTPTDSVLRSSLPAGSGGLSIDNMLRALNSMDRHPLGYRANVGPKSELIWPTALRPAAVLYRYIDSGIPVIAVLRPWDPNEQVGHAVVVVGSTFSPTPLTSASGRSFTPADLSPYFLVHDDQRGMSIRMPQTKNNPLGETPYNIEDHLQYIIVPFPDRVFMSGEKAELLALDMLSNYASDWQHFKTKNLNASCISIPLGDALEKEVIAKNYCARTYLTFGWKYKQRILENTISEDVKSLITLHDLPRMVWVTEFLLLTDLIKPKISDRRVLGHCVVDATSTQVSPSTLIFHAPGLLSLWSTATPNFYTATNQALYKIENDTPYLARHRE